MSAKALTMLAVGDVAFRRPKPETVFTSVKPFLKAADVVVCQGELPYSLRGVGTWVDFNFCHDEPADPADMKAMAAAGFNVVHLAGNHIFDLGAPGVEDTINGLHNLGISTCGAGMDLDEARRPALIEREGTRFGFLSYNCSGPIGSFAKQKKPGCAYVQILSAYELEQPCPGSRPTAYSLAEPDSLNRMIDDIQKLRRICDVLVVHFHKGIGFVPVILAEVYQHIR